MENDKNLAAVVLDDENNQPATQRPADQFKAVNGEYINPIPIEERFQKNSYIKQSCVIGVTLKQPILVITLSEVARKLERKEVEKSLRKTFSSANKNLMDHERIKHILVACEPWRTENKMLAASLKLNREYIYDKFIEMAREGFGNSSPILWE